MDVGDWFKEKVTPGFVKEVNTAIAKPASTPAEPKTPQQLHYEAQEKAMNRNNPFYRNVNEPITTEPLKVE
jgi:hypothetical protein